MAKFTPAEKPKARFTPSEELEQAPSGRKVTMPESIDWERIGYEGGYGDILPKLATMGEAAYETGKTVAGQVVGGIAGLSSLLYKGEEEEDNVSNAVSQIDRWSRATRELFPGELSEQGQRFMEEFSGVSGMEPVERMAGKAGEKVLEITGSPAAATAADVATGSFPAAVTGVRGTSIKPTKAQGPRGDQPSTITPDVKPSEAEVDRNAGVPLDRKTRKEDIKKVNEALGDLRIKTKNKKELFQSIEDVARTVQSKDIGDTLEKVRSAVINRKNAEKDIENRLWREAREGKEGFISRSHLENLQGDMKQALDGYLMEDFPKASRLMGRFDKSIENMPDTAAGKVSSLMRFRKSINQNMPSNKNDPEAGAMIAMKNTIDSFLRNKLTADMIKGDPESVGRWRQATNQSSKVKELFNPDKIIRRFAEQDATPAELRNFLFNSSDVGAKAGATRVVKNLKKILGEDSPEIEALRREAKFDMVEPLLNETPDFTGFLKKYNKFVKKNPQLVRELYTEDARRSLDTLAAAAKAGRRRYTYSEKFAQDVQGNIIAHMFGHGIAKGGARMKAARDIFTRLSEPDSSQAKLEIYREVLGYDPTRSMFSGEGAKQAAILSAQEREEKGSK